MRRTTEPSDHLQCKSKARMKPCMTSAAAAADDNNTSYSEQIARPRVQWILDSKCLVI